MNINEWLEQSPNPEEIATNADGSQYIPIGIVEQLLDDMTGGGWDTQNFKFVMDGDFISSSVELSICAADGELIKKMVGSKTFHKSAYPDNQDWAATALSECIKNAAKRLGNRFGRELNRRIEKNIVVKSSQKLKPDAKIMQKYMLAITTGDTEMANKLVETYEINIG